MSRLTLYQGLLLNLEGQIRPEQKRLYLGKEEALRQLREHTGQDFGDDVEAWRRWLRERSLL